MLEPVTPILHFFLSLFLFFLDLFLVVCVCVWVCVHTYECSCSQRPEGVASVTGGCEHPLWIIDTKYGSFARAVIFLTAEPSLQPVRLNFSLVFLINKQGLEKWLMSAKTSLIKHNQPPPNPSSMRVLNQVTEPCPNGSL